MRRKNDRIWANLQDNNCPKCGKPLHNTGSGYRCSLDCGFTIGADKAFEIKNDVAKKNKVTHVQKVLPNGKIQFKSAKIRHGERPLQPFNLGF